MPSLRVKQSCGANWLILVPSPVVRLLHSILMRRKQARKKKHAGFECACHASPFKYNEFVLAKDMTCELPFFFVLLSMSKCLSRTPPSLYFLPDLYIWSETSCNHKVTGSSPATADVSITSHLSCQNVLEQRTGPLPAHSL